MSSINVSPDRLSALVRGQQPEYLLPTSVLVVAAVNRPIPPRAGYQQCIVLDNGPLSPCFGPRAVALHFNAAAALMWSLAMILKAARDTRDNKQVTLLSATDDPVDFPLDSADFRALLRDFPQVCKFSGFRFHNPEFLRCYGKMFCLLNCELVPNNELVHGLRIFNGQLTVCHKTLSLRLLDLLADPSVTMRCIELLHKPTEPISRLYAYKCSLLNCNTFSIISSTLDRSSDILQELVKGNAKPGHILVGASFHLDRHPERSMKRFFDLAKLVENLSGVGLRGLHTHQMDTCASIIATGMLPLKKTTRFMINAESVSPTQGKTLVDALQPLKKLCSVQFIAKDETTEDTPLQYQELTRSLDHLVRTHLSLSEVFVSPCIVKDADRTRLAGLVKDNEFVRNYDPSVSLSKLVYGRTVTSRTCLYMALRGSVNLMSEDYKVEHRQHFELESYAEHNDQEAAHALYRSRCNISSKKPWGPQRCPKALAPMGVRFQQKWVQDFVKDNPNHGKSREDLMRLAASDFKTLPRAEMRTLEATHKRLVTKFNNDTASYAKEQKYHREYNHLVNRQPSQLLLHYGHLLLEAVPPEAVAEVLPVLMAQRHTMQESGIPVSQLEPLQPAAVGKVFVDQEIGHVARVPNDGQDFHLFDEDEYDVKESKGGQDDEDELFVREARRHYGYEDEIFMKESMSNVGDKMVAQRMKQLYDQGEDTVVHQPNHDGKPAMAGCHLGKRSRQESLESGDDTKRLRRP